MAFCLPFTSDPRLKLLKQATVTGMPARSRDSVARTQSTMSRTTPRFSDLSIDDKKAPLTIPPPPPPPDTIEELLVAPLSVDIATVFDEEDEDEATPSLYVRAKPEGAARVAAQSVGAFTRRAYVAQGNYRVGWMIDSERSDCVRCRRRFSAMVRRHHCRACGDVFCDVCTRHRSYVPNLIGDFHRVCGSCFEKVTEQFSVCSEASVAPRKAQSEGHPSSSTTKQRQHSNGRI